MEDAAEDVVIPCMVSRHLPVNVQILRLRHNVLVFFGFSKLAACTRPVSCLRPISIQTLSASPIISFAGLDMGYASTSSHLADK